MAEPQLDTGGTSSTAPRGIRVWDLPVRIFHWALVALVLGLVVSGKLGGNALDWHQRCGYAVLALVLFRLLWGFAGSTHARFSGFLRGPAAVAAYLAELLGRRPRRPYPGHNPLGGWSVLAMLAGLLLQASTGLFANDGVMTEGPLYRYVSNASSDFLTYLHHLNANLLLALVALHVAAILFYGLAKHENLVWPMVTGYKADAALSRADAARGGPLWLAAVLAAACAGLVWWLITRL